MGSGGPSDGELLLTCPDGEVITLPDADCAWALCGDPELTDLQPQSGVCEPFSNFSVSWLSGEMPIFQFIKPRTYPGPYVGSLGEFFYSGQFAEPLKSGTFTFTSTDSLPSLLLGFGLHHPAGCEVGSEGCVGFTSRSGNRPAVNSFTVSVEREGDKVVAAEFTMAGLSALGFYPSPINLSMLPIDQGTVSFLVRARIDM